MFEGIARSGYKSGELSEPITSESELAQYAQRKLKRVLPFRAVKRLPTQPCDSVINSKTVINRFFQVPPRKVDPAATFAVKKALKQFKKQRAIQVITSPGCTPLLTWISGNPDINLNGQVKKTADNKVIYCDNLAYTYAEGNIGRGKPLFHEINTKDKLQKYSGIKTSGDILRNKQKGCPSYAIYFDADQFPKAIYKVALELTDDHPRKDLLLVTTAHVMALTIAILGHGSILLHCYDPNKTICHRKILMQSIGDLDLLSFNPLFEEQSGSYFHIDTKTCVIRSTETLPKRDNCKVECLAAPSAGLINELMTLGHFGHPSLSINTSDLTRDQLSGTVHPSTLYKGCEDGVYWVGLYQAFTYFKEEAICDYVKSIVSSRMNENDKYYLLESCNYSGVPVLHYALLIGKPELLKAYMLPILSTKLKKQTVLALTSKQNKNQKSALLFGFENKHLDIIETFMEIVINSKLSDLIKVKILRGTVSFNDTPIITILNKLEDKEPVECYRKVIQKSSLSANEKTDILNPGTLLYADEE